ncbi:MAG: hypothetical protein DRJ50_15490 [Actinobacteria bacterium]|nr:MAG: hypothetical protein DRJ50_15490 [Actinomycetota bacterium]
MASSPSVSHSNLEAICEVLGDTTPSSSIVTSWELAVRFVACQASAVKQNRERATQSILCGAFSFDEPLF